LNTEKYAGGNAGQLGPQKARRTPHTLCGLQTLAPPPPPPTYSLAHGPAVGPLFFYIFMIKLSMFKNWKTLRSSQN